VLSEIQEKEIYEQGYRSYRQNDGSYLNPYPIDTEEFMTFERGWSQAIRRSADQRGPYIPQRFR